MSKFEQYNLVLKDIVGEKAKFEYTLDDVFFKKIDSPEVQRGSVTAQVSVHKTISTFDLEFQLEGSIIVPCDRCLDDMEQPIRHKEKLQVKFGDKFSEEDEIVIVPASEGAINIAWFLYEFIVLNIPIKHVHAPGVCNKTMVTKLKRHIIRNKDDADDSPLDLDDDDDDVSTEETTADPRWDALQNITENN